MNLISMKDAVTSINKTRPLFFFNHSRQINFVYAHYKTCPEILPFDKDEEKEDYGLFMVDIISLRKIFFFLP
jgi:hypothetical protein